MTENLQPSFEDFAYENLKESFQGDRDTKTEQSVNFLWTLNLDEEVKPFINEIAERRGFDSILSMSLENRIEEQIDDVRTSEKIFTNGDENRMGKYIPVGATYVDYKLGMFVLHQNIDLTNNSLGDTFYLTRHVLKERINGQTYSDITFVKFTLNQKDEKNQVEVMTLNPSQKKFPYFKDVFTGRVSSTPDYSRVERLTYKRSPEVRKNIFAFINTSRPDPNLLVKTYELIKMPKEN